MVEGSEEQWLLRFVLKLSICGEYGKVFLPIQVLRALNHRLIFAFLTFRRVCGANLSKIPCARFLFEKGVDFVVETDWDWEKNKHIFMKERDFYELFRIWWTICSTTT